MSARTKVAVIGLDCAEPSLVFDRWLDELPNLARLVRGGTWGRLRSVDPPITVPAWSCMISGRDPGELGIYGFRNRRDHSYDGLDDGRLARGDRGPRLGPRGARGPASRSSSACRRRSRPPRSTASWSPTS